jgi:hypothetical protein
MVPFLLILATILLGFCFSLGIASFHERRQADAQRAAAMNSRQKDPVESKTMMQPRRVQAAFRGRPTCSSA